MSSMLSRTRWLLVAGLGLAANMAPAAAAAGGSWTAIGPDLSSVPALAVSPSGTLYAGTTQRGVFQSANGGARWNAPPASPSGSYLAVRELAIDPGDPRRVYVHSFDGLYRRDAGGALQYVGLFTPPGPPTDAFAAAPSDPRRLYLLEAPFIGISRDRGASWEEA